MKVNKTILRRFNILNQNSKDDESIQFYIFWLGFDIRLLAINERTTSCKELIHLLVILYYELDIKDDDSLIKFDSSNIFTKYPFLSPSVT